jgi:inosine-uridine nucleoside N-ribohydrolase
VRIHVDTDFAGDTDDAAALAMVLGWPDTELVGVTTVADPDGRRAGYASHLLHLAGRSDVPVAAGAGTSRTTGRPMGDLPEHGAYWGDEQVPARPDRPGVATALLAASIDLGATVVAIGPCTNLALLEEARPGLLQSARVVVMGGWVGPAPDGFPPWGPAMDWNVQCDPVATLTVLAACPGLTLVTLTAAMGAHLRRRHLPRLEGSGPVGRLLARQARAHGAEHDMASLARAHHRLPADLLNVQWDPVACAVALGWPGAPAAATRLRPVFTDGALHFEMGAGTPVDVVLAVDGPAFEDRWLDAVASVDRAGRPT